MPNMPIDLLLEALRIGESADWEFKSARGGFPGSFWETYSAMANSEGGAIVLGIRDEDGQVSVDGLTLEQAKAHEKTFWDLVHNKNKISRNLLAAADAKIHEVQNGFVLVVRVPRANRTERPVYMGQNPLGGTFRRRAEGDYRCSDDEVRRMLADADPEPRDQKILAGFDLNDLDPASLKQYRQRLLAAKGDHAWLALEDRPLLEKLGGWRQDRATGQQGLTLAGLLMFGKDQSIRDPNATPSYFVDYREKLDPNIRWSDRIYPDGTWEANLFQFYQRVWPKLSAGLPVPFHLEGGLRRDETPVHEALREAFVNALIHADYAAPGGVVVERYPDRFVLENPGTLLVSFEQYRRGGVSECRNKSLQKMFLMIGGGEQAGSGVDKIRSSWKSRLWRTPWIETFDQPDRVQLTLPMVSLIPDDILAQLRTRFGAAKVDALSAVEVQAIATAALEQGVTNARLRDLTDEHRVDITRILQGLCERGFLISDHKRRWASYRLAPGNSVPLGGDSVPLGGDSIPLAGDSLPLEEPDETLAPLAKPVSEKKKADPKEMREAILRLCDGRYLSSEKLARLLKRNPDRLRREFLRPMVQEGILRLRFPGNPNRPDQAYSRATSSE